MKIRKRILIGFGVIGVFWLLCIGNAIININQVRTIWDDAANTAYKPVESLKTMNESLLSFKYSTLKLYYQENRGEIEADYNMAADHLNEMNNSVEAYKTLLEGTGLTQEAFKNQYESLLSVETIAAELEKTLMDLKESKLKGNIGSAGASNYYEENIAGKIAEIDVFLDNAERNLDEFTQNAAVDAEIGVKSKAVRYGWQSAIIFGITAVIAIIYARRISKPFELFASTMEEISDGDLDVSIALNSNDEIGVISRNVSKIIDIIRSLLKDLNSMAQMQEDGYINYNIHTENYAGVFKEVAEAINGMVETYIKNDEIILLWMKEISKGDFDAEIKEFVNERAIVNTILESVRQEINGVRMEMESLIESLSNGDLDQRTDINKFQGGWADIATGLNSMMDTVAGPVREVREVMELISKGDLEAKITGSYLGDFAMIKSSVNATVDDLSQYINEISIVLSEVAKGNFKVDMELEYKGDFRAIRTAIESIIDSLSTIVTEIRQTSDQVAIGSQHISDSNMQISNGATQQASAAQELTSTVDMLFDRTKGNAQGAKEASNLAMAVRDDAYRGTEKMDDMLEAMAAIKSSSSDISSIIRVIDDIAFQTNILSLNAAVEAARAGVNGRGFAVVAEEVRNLAGKSQDAVQETTDLIEATIGKVNTGSKLANETADSLNRMVDGISQVADLVENIQEASAEQVIGLSQVSDGVKQITTIIQSNSATSEENAASSEELSVQAEILKQMMSQFQLRDAME